MTRRACVFLGGLYRAEQVDCRAAAAPGRRNTALAAHRSGQGAAMDRAEDRPVARREPDRRHPAGPAVEGPGHHRRAGRGQDDHRQRHPAHPGGEGREPAALRADRPRRQADDGSHRVRSQDHSPAARGRSQGRRFQTRQRQPARLRPAGRRRDVDGRCPADAGAAEGGPRPCRAADRRRHRSAALCRARVRSWPT